MEWQWVYELMQQELYMLNKDIGVSECIRLLEDANLMCAFLDEAVITDASKEFSQMAQVSYGIDEDICSKENDFETVRGTLNNSVFVKQYKDNALKEKKQREEMIKRLQTMMAQA